MMKRETLHETNVAGSDGGLAYNLLCFRRRRRAHFRTNCIPFTAAAQMADGDMAIVPQIRVAFLDGAKVFVVVFIKGFHPFLPQNKYFQAFNF
jgi:hypothetical protein